MNSSKSWRTGSTQAGGRQATPDRLWVWMSGRRLARLPIGMVVVALLASLFGPLGRTVAGAAEGPAATAGSGSSSARLIVKLASGMSRDQQRQVVQRNGGTLVSEITRLSMVVISVPAAEASNHSKRYQADKQVRRVDANRSRKASAAPNDPAYAGQWALPKIGWDAARDTVAPAGSATIAVLDTGVAPVADLEGRLVPGYTAFPNTDPQVDANGHGTALATIAAAAADNSAGIAGVGYAAGVKVMPVRVLDDSGLGQDSDVIAGVVHAADNGADVILMGFSAPGFSQSLQDAVDYAWSKGAVLVAATGNAGSTEPTYPAGDAKVVGVSATDQNDGLWPSSNSGASAFLGAPGVEIGAVAPGGGTTSITGTSGSAAVVAGSAALLAANDSAASNGVIVGRLARNADAAGTADQTGNGRVNLARAIADTSTEAVVPAGAAPLGSGGPFVGPYVVAAGGGLTVSATFNVSTSSITGSISGGGDPNSQKFYQYSYTAPGASAPSFVSPCLAGAAGGSNTYFLPPGYTAGMWTVSVSRFNANDGGVCHVSRKDADGSITVSAAASIRGAALNDVDGDSSANDGAAPLVGATVTLYKAAVGTATARSSSDTTVGTSTSSSTGAYGFASGLVSGTYFLVRSNPASAGWFSTNAISGSGTGTSSSKVSNDEIRVVLSTTSASTTGNNFLAQQRNASISGTIFNDVNNNGVKDAGETGTVGGGTIGISGGTPPVSLTPLTVTAGGTYSFTGLQAGNYTLTYSAPSGYSPTGPNPQTITLSASESVTRDFLAHTNAAPVVDLNSATTGNDNTATFTEDGAAAALAGLATVVDADDTSLASATVTLTNDLDGAAESLAAATADTAITASYSAATGVLSLTGTDTVANYQKVLRTITYANTSQNPNTTARSVTFVVNDGTAPSVSRTTTVTVTAVNDAPAASAQSVSTDEDVAKLITLAGTDVDGDTLSIKLTSLPASGALFVGSGTAGHRIVAADLTATPTGYALSGNQVTYLGNNNFNGSDGFNFRTRDAALESAPATVSITVNPVNDAPAASAQSVSTDEDVAKLITLAGTDVDGDTLSIKVTSLPASGALFVGSGTAGHRIVAADLTATPTGYALSGNQVTYLGNNNFNGSDGFNFRTRDAALESAPATVSITVNPVNDAPTFTVTADGTAISSVTAQYSDSIPSVVVTATDIDSIVADLTLTHPDLPLDLEQTVVATPPANTKRWEITGRLNRAEGSVPVSLVVSDGALTNPSTSQSLTVNVIKEDASIIEIQPGAVAVARAGNTSASVTVTVTIEEPTTDGELSRTLASGTGLGNATPVDIVLTPVGQGSGFKCQTTSTTYRANSDNTATASCTIPNVSINVYQVDATIGGNYFRGTGQGALTVYDPAQGHSSGGGWFRMADGTKVNYGFTAKVLKSGQTQGSVLTIFHGANGNRVVKSNSMNPGVANSKIMDGTTVLGYSTTFSGKATYQVPTPTLVCPGSTTPSNKCGNYGFTVYAEDRKEPGAGADKFWIEVKNLSESGSPVVERVGGLGGTAPEKAAVISGGNVQVPR